MEGERNREGKRVREEGVQEEKAREGKEERRGTAEKERDKRVQ